MTAATIAVVDDHALLAETVCAALTSRDIRAIPVATGEDRQLLSDLLELNPDLVLLDLDLGPAGEGTVLIGPLARAGVRVLVVSGLTDPTRLAMAIEHGAIGVHPKASGFDELVAAARRALATSGPFDPDGNDRLLAAAQLAWSGRSSVRGRLATLTDREAATLRALGDGLTVHEIARRWVVSEATVRTHVQAVLRKLNVTSQLQAVVEAMRTGWLEPVSDTGWQPPPTGPQWAAASQVRPTPIETSSGTESS